MVLSDAVANPATGVWVEAEVNGENVPLRWTNLNLPQNAYMFELEVYAMVEITSPQVTLQLIASPEEGGSVSAAPASSEYDQGAEVILSAKRNFGYAFVKWMDANGQTLSTDDTYKQILNENLVTTAAFEPMATYSLSTHV